MNVDLKPELERLIEAEIKAGRASGTDEFLIAKAGFSVTGIDLVESKVERINAGDSYIQDVSPSVIENW